MNFCSLRYANSYLTRNKRYPWKYIAQPNRLYANYPNAPKKEPSTGIQYTVGALAVISAVTIGYAKYDTEFRKLLEDNVPGTEKLFKILFNEDGRGILQSFLDELHALITGEDPALRRRLREQPYPVPKLEYDPPNPVFQSLLEEKKEEEKYDEVRVQDAEANVEIVQEKPEQRESINSPKLLADLELKIRSSGIQAIEAYNKAGAAFKDYCRDIEEIVQMSVERLDPTVWTSLKHKTEVKDELHKDANHFAKNTIDDLERFRCLVDEANFPNCDEAKATARRNIERYISDIASAKDHFEKEKKNADVINKYWKKVEDARCHFIDELEILFPTFDINKKNLSLKPSDLDLFLVYAFAQVLYYQKELNRMETVLQSRLKQAMDAVKKGDPHFDIKEIAITEEIDREKRKLAAEFQKKCLALRQDSERELRHRLKCQEQAHVDHLADVLATREAEVQRDFQRKLDERIVEEQGRYKTQMAGMVARMTGMRNAISERLEAEKIAHQSQILWSACQALHRAVKLTQPGVPWTEQMRPLQCELDAIQKAAAEEDELVKIVLASVPDEARGRGVFPEGALRERFIQVEKEARRLALVPKEGARLPLYFLSFLQAALLWPSVNPIPQTELANEKVDFSKLDTYDILQRARYWIDRGNYTQTLKYMNLLKGAPRCIASQWMYETRILLETQQAAETLMAHAVAGGLKHF